jgi:vacuolar protein sorting-associated protein 18
MALNPIGSNGSAPYAAGMTGGGEPMFDVQRVPMQFSIAADFVAAQVANDMLVMALSNGRILRIDLNKPEDIDGL